MNSIEEIEKYAYENDIPIMQKVGIDFLCNFIKQNNIKRILEIGSAIGYSAIKMALVSSDIKIVTIERDKERFDLAVKNIDNLKLSNQINIRLEDALESQVDGEFDLIFIDAAKAQYIKFFNKYSTNLSKKGFIISDNMSFHGLTEKVKEIKSRNLRQLVTKINKYKDFLLNNEEFNTEFYQIGDGIAISSRKE